MTLRAMRNGANKARHDCGMGIVCWCDVHPLCSSSLGSSGGGQKTRLCRTSLGCEFLYKRRACGAEQKKNGLQHAERSLPWINRGTEMCEKGHGHLEGEQRSVYIIFSMFSEGQG